jgi:exopolyphosphatase/guanosine-5'-triphosphate,3'-diphosphate pyrophosphatase
MTEQFIHTDPPAPNELAQMEEFATEMFQSIAAQFNAEPGVVVAAVGGTAATLAALHLGGYDPDRVHGLELTREIIESIYQKLAALTTPRRAALPGIEPKRADIITAGAGNYVCLLRALGLPGFRVSLHDIRHGLLEFILSGQWDALPVYRDET